MCIPSIVIICLVLAKVRDCVPCTMFTTVTHCVHRAWLVVWYRMKSLPQKMCMLASWMALTSFWEEAGESAFVLYHAENTWRKGCQCTWRKTFLQNWLCWDPDARFSWLLKWREINFSSSHPVWYFIIVFQTRQYVVPFLKIDNKIFKR